MNGMLPLYPLLSVRSTLAPPLSILLKDILLHDPSVMAARTESASARSGVKQAHSTHWPVITVAGSKLLSQNHHYSYNYGSEDTFPGIRGEMNILASGATEANVRQNKSEAGYYYLKEKETGEETIRFSALLCLDAPREE